jgi:hypothetical protein
VKSINHCGRFKAKNRERKIDRNVFGKKISNKEVQSTAQYLAKNYGANHKLCYNNACLFSSSFCHIRIKCDFHAE